MKNTIEHSRGDDAEEEEEENEDDEEEVKDENFPELKCSSLDGNSTSVNYENKAFSDKTATSLKRRRLFSDEKLPPTKRAKVEYNTSIGSCSSQASSCQ